VIFTILRQNNDRQLNVHVYAPTVNYTVTVSLRVCNTWPRSSQTATN